MKPVVLVPAARAEFDASAAWYKLRARGLGERFVASVDSALQRIAEGPASFPMWDADVRFRRVVTERFPYVVFYRDMEQQIEVVAIAHGARQPGYWLKRR